MEQNLIFILVFLNSIIISISLVQNWNFDNSAIDLLSASDTATLSFPVIEGTTDNLYVKLYKYLAKTSDGVVYKKYLTISYGGTIIYDGLEVDYDDIESFHRFDDDNIIHVDGSVDPARDIETINLELIFADMETVQKRRDKAEKSFRGGDKKAGEEVELAGRLYTHLESGKPARTLDCSDDEKQIMQGWFLLTTKPVIYAANIAEDDLGKNEDEIPYVQQVKKIASAEDAGVIVISAAIEQDIASMSPDEKKEFLEELGIGQSGLDRLITASYQLLGLISFLTAGEDECRAWTIVKGTKAPQAAGKIHTDFEKGFIRAEIVPFETLAELGSMAACKEKGLVRSEGKDYVMKDGDITLFRFNV